MEEPIDWIRDESLESRSSSTSGAPTQVVDDEEAIAGSETCGCVPFIRG